MGRPSRVPWTPEGIFDNAHRFLGPTPPGQSPPLPRALASLSHVVFGSCGSTSVEYIFYIGRPFMHVAEPRKAPGRVASLLLGLAPLTPGVDARSWEKLGMQTMHNPGLPGGKALRDSRPGQPPGEASPRSIGRPETGRRISGPRARFGRGQASRTRNTGTVLAPPAGLSPSPTRCSTR